MSTTVKLRQINSIEPTPALLELLNYNNWIIEGALNSVGAVSPVPTSSPPPATIPIRHDQLLELTDDDHLQYLLLGGRFGGQDVTGVLRVNGSVILTETAVQQISNKTIDNTCSLTIKDQNFLIVDQGDTSKILSLEVSGIASGNTRTWTVPNYSGIPAVPANEGNSGQLLISGGAGVQPAYGALPAHAASHQTGGSDAIKLDDLAAPDDNTDLNASTTKHGLMQKYPNDTTKFLRGDGTFQTVAAEAFPVGSVFIAVVSTNPGTLLGYGTWSAFGAGRVLVGLNAGDADFDTVEETGGAKTVASAGTIGANDVGLTGAAGATGFAADGHVHDYTGSATSVVQPYIVVYMWKRTA